MFLIAYSIIRHPVLLYTTGRNKKTRIGSVYTGSNLAV